MAKAVCDTTKLVLSKGAVYVRRIDNETQLPIGQLRYLGNTPAFKISVETEKKEHMCSDRGVNEVDFSATTKVTRKGSIETDHIDPKNLALMFLGSESSISVAAAVGLTHTASDATNGSVISLGASPTDAVGSVKVTNVVVTDAGGTVGVVGTDYDLDADGGIVYIKNANAFTFPSTLTITYDVDASTRDQVITGATNILVEILFVQENVTGINRNYSIPLVNLSPSGDIDFKADDFMKLTFDLEILKAGDLEAVTASNVT